MSVIDRIREYKYIHRILILTVMYSIFRIVINTILMVVIYNFMDTQYGDLSKPISYSINTTGMVLLGFMTISNMIMGWVSYKLIGPIKKDIRMCTLIRVDNLVKAVSKKHK